MENNEYNSLLERVQSIITGKGYKIESNLLGEEYTFNIKDNDVIASNIRIYKTDGNIITGKTRTLGEIILVASDWLISSFTLVAL